MLRRRLPGSLLALLALLAVALTACGSDDDPVTPVACLEGSGAYLSALERAPGEVRIAGATPISDCLVSDQEPAAQNAVGAAAVEAATELNTRATRGRERAAVRLGYLVGAVQEGAAATGGIHTDLVRRLDSAARFNEGGGTLPVSFERAFGRGYAAGQASG